MTSPKYARYRTREIDSLFRWDPDVWKPITLLAVLLAMATGASVFLATYLTADWLFAAYVESDGHEALRLATTSFGSGMTVLLTVINSRPMDWRSGIIACSAATLVVGLIIVTAIAAVALMVGSGTVDGINAALPYAVPISGIPGVLAVLGVVLLLGRWPAAPADLASEAEDASKETKDAEGTEGGAA